MDEVDKNEEKRSTGHITVHKHKVVSVDARSIMNKLDELQCIAGEENPDIICITETWAHKDIIDAELNMEGYNLVRNDRGHERRWLHHIHTRQYAFSYM